MFEEDSDQMVVSELGRQKIGVNIQIQRQRNFIISMF